LVKFLVKSLIHADSNKEEEWFNGQDDNASHDPDFYFMDVFGPRDFKPTM
jgi:hypothetical protein